MAARRIIPRDELMLHMLREPAKAHERPCRCTLKLDGTEYRCGRSIIDGFHEGIHDAFATHGDGGAVRW